MDRSDGLESVVAVAYDIDKANQSVMRNRAECNCITQSTQTLVSEVRKFLDLPAFDQEHTVNSIITQIIHVLRSARRLIVACSYGDNCSCTNSGLPTVVGSGKNVVEARLLPLKLHEMIVRITHLTTELGSISVIGKSVTDGVHNNADTGDSHSYPSESAYSENMKDSDVDNTLTWVERQVVSLGIKEPAEARGAAVGALHARMLELEEGAAPFITELVEAGALPMLAHLLASGTDEGKERAAAILWRCAKDTTYRGLVVAAEAVPRLAGLLTHPRVAVREQAVGALSCLAWDPDGRRCVVESGAVPTLSGMLVLGSPGCVESAAATLWALTAGRSALNAVVGVSGTVGRLVTLLARGGTAGAEYAAGALWNLARGSESQGEVVRAGGVPELVSVLNSSTSTPTAKERAVAALAHIAANSAYTGLVTEAGPAGPAVAQLVKGTDIAQRKAALLLAALARTPDTLGPVLAAGAVPALTRVLYEGSAAAREEAAGALLQCAQTSGIERAIAEAGAVPRLSGMLFSDCGASVYRAAALLRLMSAHEGLVFVLLQAGAVCGLVRVLCSDPPPAADATEEVVGCLRNMARDGYCAEEMVGSGAVPPLAQLVLSGASAAFESATAVLCGLAEHSDLACALVEGGALPALVHLLGTEGGTLALREMAARALRCLAVDPATHGAIGTAEGAIPAIVSVTGVPGFTEYAMAVLLNLARHPEHRPDIAATDVSDRLVGVLTNHLQPEGVQCLAAELVWELAQDGAITRTALIGAGAVPGLVRMLSEGADRGRYLAAGALWNLAVDAEGRAAIAGAGAVPLLVRLLPPESGEAHVVAAAALWNLSADNVLQAAIAKEGAVSVLTFLLETGTPEAQGYACAALRNLALLHANRRLIADAGAVPRMLELIMASTTLPQARICAVSTLWYVSLSSRLVPVVRATGAVPVLLQLLREGDSALQEEALGALSVLGAPLSALLEAGGRGVLVRLLDRVRAEVPDHGDHRARLALLRLADDMGLALD